MTTAMNFSSLAESSSAVERQADSIEAKIDRELDLPAAPERIEPSIIDEDFSGVLSGSGRPGNPGAGNGSKSSRLVKILALGALIVALLAGAFAGYNFYQVASTHQETDDAYVTGHMHQVSTRVNGTVAQVLVDDNEHVKAGQLLVALDPSDYQVKVKQARAALDTALQQSRVAQANVSYAATNANGQVTTAQGAISNARAGIARAGASVNEAQAAVFSARANLSAKEAELTRAESDFERYKKLESQGAVAVQELDNARRDFKVAQENVNGAREEIKQSEAKLAQARESVNTARAQLVQAQGQIVLAQASGTQTAVNERQFDVTRTSISQAQAALDEALLNLSYSRIYAPTNGRVGKKTVEVGQRVEPGQPLLTVVSDETWVVANFKETQLKQMRPGDSVEIKIDSFADHKFEGQVLSFAPGSGASFALLPSDNATGNFTKIVQRVPVKIVFDQPSLKGYRDLLVPGMSAVANVSVKSR
ncbi:MAG: HlyD family secretion protein [Cyanobacteria bacterium REEB67]|nr:HlyD family secretion protein [Cyanobacteria bacterium REEB67]